MPEYDVELLGYRPTSAIVRVEADNREQAELKALSNNYRLNWIDESDVEIDSIGSVVKVV